MAMLSEEIVEAIEQRELLATGVQEAVATADSQFLERLEAVGGETRCRDGYALGAAFAIARRERVGRRLQPLRPAEPDWNANRTRRPSVFGS